MWVIPIIQGFVQVEELVVNYNETPDEERSSPETPPQEVTCVDDIHPRFTVALISRRSRHRAGKATATVGLGVEEGAPQLRLSQTRGSSCAIDTCCSHLIGFRSQKALSNPANNNVVFLVFRWRMICDLNNMNRVDVSSLSKGMRYKRRGVDTDGHVANYVETEQLIHVHSHTLSFVQTRGSVPVFWSQAGYRYNPRPRLEKGQWNYTVFHMVQ